LFLGFRAAPALDADEPAAGRSKGARRGARDAGILQRLPWPIPGKIVRRRLFSQLRRN